MRTPLLSFLFITISVIAVFSSCSEEEVKFKRYYADGLDVYKLHCQSCHMQDGTGLPGVIPPLTDTAFLNKNRKQLACIVKYGLDDTIYVHGEMYNTAMPAESHLTAIEIAKVLTYVTNSFGNNQGIYDVTETQQYIDNMCE
ncbi:cytochrome c [Pseudoxanthomonas sp. SGD-10]|nr:cytochrome c [Pseudoxanthomonas sp. SGD-10]